MSGGIEVNTAYKGVAASWLGLDPNFYSRKRKAVDDDDTLPLVYGGGNLSKNKNSQKKDSKSLPEMGTLTRSPNHINKNRNDLIKTNGLIKNKIEKRLQFNARDRHTEFKGKKRKMAEEEEESKSFQVKNKNVNPLPAALTSGQGQTIKDLNTRLLDPGLSKKARKRIRKKIASLTT